MESEAEGSELLEAVTRMILGGDTAASNVAVTWTAAEVSPGRPGTADIDTTTQPPAPRRLCNAAEHFASNLSHVPIPTPLDMFYARASQTRPNSPADPAVPEELAMKPGVHAEPARPDAAPQPPLRTVGRFTVCDDPAAVAVDSSPETLEASALSKSHASTQSEADYTVVPTINCSPLAKELRDAVAVLSPPEPRKPEEKKRKHTRGIFRRPSDGQHPRSWSRERRRRSLSRARKRAGEGSQIAQTILAFFSLFSLFMFWIQSFLR